MPKTQGCRKFENKTMCRGIPRKRHLQKAGETRITTKQTLRQKA